MKVILLKDVKGKGKKDDVIEVSDGYGNNYLIKNKLAVMYTKGSKNVLEHEINIRQQKEDALICELNIIKGQLENKDINFKVSTGKGDKVFGNISTKQICEELKKKGFNIDKNRQQLGRVLLIGQQRLFDPKYIKAMQMIHQGVIGDVVGVRNYWYRNNDWRREVPSPELERHINWRLYSEYSRGLMTELACHQLQNGSWAMGMLPERVMGAGSLVHWKEDGRDVYDSVSAIFSYPNGVNMTFESIISNKHFGMGEQILGTKGTIDLVTAMHYTDEPAPRGSGIHQLIEQIEQGVMSNSVFAGTSWAAETSSLAAGRPIMQDVKVVSGESSVGAEADGSKELLEAFVNSVICGKQPEKVLEESYYATQYALLADKAMHEGAILTLDEKYKIPYEPLK